MEWINFLDRQPKKDIRVLIHLIGDDKNIIISSMEDDFWCNDDGSSLELDAVDYWMELQNPPEQKKSAHDTADISAKLDSTTAIQKKNWLSIKKASKCLFSRRNGYQGSIVLGYSIRLRIFGKDII